MAMNPSVAYPQHFIAPPAKLHDHYAILRERFGERKAALRRALTGTADELYADGTCVVLGAAPTLIGAGMGTWIDAHDRVWRANHHVPGFDVFAAEDVGVRTDVYVTSYFHVAPGHDCMKAAQKVRSENPKAEIVIWPPEDRVPSSADPWLQQQGPSVYASLNITATVNEWMDTVGKVHFRTVCHKIERRKTGLRFTHTHTCTCRASLPTARGCSWSTMQC